MADPALAVLRPAFPNRHFDDGKLFTRAGLFLHSVVNLIQRYDRDEIFWFGGSDVSGVDPQL